MTLPPPRAARRRRVSDEDLSADLRRARDLDVDVAVELLGSPAALAVLDAPLRGNDHGLDRQERLENALTAAIAAGQPTGRAAELLAEAQALRWGAVVHRASVARQEAHKHAHGSWTEDELNQFALIGLYEGAKRFDPDAGANFATYGRWWSRAEVTRQIEEGISSSTNELLRNLKKLEAHGPVSDDSAAVWLRISPEQVAELRGLRDRMRMVSLDTTVDEDETPLIETLAADEPEEQNTAEVERVHAHVAELSVADRQLLTARFGLDGDEPVTLREIAEGRRLSRERIRQLERKALGRLRDLLEADMDEVSTAPRPVETPVRPDPAPAPVAPTEPLAPPRDPVYDQLRWVSPNGFSPRDLWIRLGGQGDVAAVVSRLEALEAEDKAHLVEGVWFAGPGISSRRVLPAVAARRALVQESAALRPPPVGPRSGRPVQVKGEVIGRMVGSVFVVGAKAPVGDGGVPLVPGGAGAVGGLQLEDSVSSSPELSAEGESGSSVPSAALPPTVSRTKPHPPGDADEGTSEARQAEDPRGGGDGVGTAPFPSAPFALPAGAMRVLERLQGFPRGAPVEELVVSGLSKSSVNTYLATLRRQGLARCEGAVGERLWFPLSPDAPAEPPIAAPVGHVPPTVVESPPPPEVAPTPDLVGFTAPPAHYDGGADLEAIDRIWLDCRARGVDAADGDRLFAAFCTGNALKYRLRLGKKTEGDAEKALWYERMAVHAMGGGRRSSLRASRLGSAPRGSASRRPGRPDPVRLLGASRHRRVGPGAVSHRARCPLHQRPRGPARAAGVPLSNHHMTIAVEPLGLGNVCDGRVATQFQSALEKVAEAFEDPDLNQGREKLSAKVVIEVAFEYRPDTAALTLTGSVRTKLPEPKKAGSTAMLRNGRFLVEPDTQLALELHTNGRKDAGEDR